MEALLPRGHAPTFCNQQDQGRREHRHEREERNHDYAVRHFLGQGPLEDRNPPVPVDPPPHKQDQDGERARLDPTAAGPGGGAHEHEK